MSGSGWSRPRSISVSVLVCVRLASTFRSLTRLTQAGKPSHVAFRQHSNSSSHGRRLCPGDQLLGNVRLNPKPDADQRQCRLRDERRIVTGGSEQDLASSDAAATRASTGDGGGFPRGPQPRLQPSLAPRLARHGQATAESKLTHGRCWALMRRGPGAKVDRDLECCLDKRRK